MLGIRISITRMVHNIKLGIVKIIYIYIVVVKMSSLGKLTNLPFIYLFIYLFIFEQYCVSNQRNETNCSDIPFVHAVIQINYKHMQKT